ncbi:MAG: hypothetical protein JXB30_08360 [Anaerolineae bacterium]|nr:hypothetical protein [Anaerolineae bacterium]
MSQDIWGVDPEPTEIDTGLTQNDRFSAILAVVLTVAALGLGLLIKQRSSTDTWPYESRGAGISANYPVGWLVDERGNYVVRMRDPKARPFKTQYIITIVPMGGQTSTRNVLDGLTLQRSTDLPAYRVLSVQETNSGGVNLTVMNFAFVDADPNPFIQRLPVAVLGIDILIRDEDRAIIITYMSDKQVFEENRPSFDRFLSSLRY